MYFDHAGDGGLYDAASDHGLAGVDVTLQLDVDGDGTVDFTRTTTTDGNGDYSFGNLIAGDYTITVDSGDLPDQLGANPTYNAGGTLDSVTSVMLGLGEASAAASLGYHGAPDYTISVDDGLNNLTWGETTTYTITLTNNGTSRGQNVVVTDTFPTSVLEILSASHGGVVDLNLGTVTWNLSEVGMGETVVLTVSGDVASPPPAGTTRLATSVSVVDDGVNGADPDLTNNSDGDVNTANDAPPESDPQDDLLVIYSNSFNKLRFPESKYREENESSGTDPDLADSSDNDLNTVNDTPPENDAQDDSFVFSFDSFNKLGFPESKYHEEKESSEENEIFEEVLLVKVDPVFSGLSEPASKLNVVIYDDSGNIVGSEEVETDPDGNWRAQFPTAVVSGEQSEFKADTGRKEIMDDAGLVSARRAIDTLHKANRQPVTGWQGHLFQMKSG